MMKAIKLLLILMAINTTSSFGQKVSLQELNFLIGTWKMEGKNSFERWDGTADKFTGKSYKIVDGTERISETIEIKVQGENIVYSPTVPNQNDGRAIPFMLESTEENEFSFENPNHDFPKKIQYKILSKTELLVSVLGENDKGFSFNLTRQLE